MRGIILAAALLMLPISGCSTLGAPPPTPATYAQLTTADEQVAVTAHQGYKAFRLAVETGVKAGFIKGAVATKVADLDNLLFTGLTAIDNAYAAGNATSFHDAVAHFNQFLTTANATLGSK